ncbi:MAG: sigma-70 family RNA polymerase sigma factor [Archangiaceae bacterium]|nr:sigma-70 family RNA polymerase sigma factor [Archangiaceae bacterium]
MSALVDAGLGAFPELVPHRAKLLAQLEGRPLPAQPADLVLATAARLRLSGAAERLEAHAFGPARRAAARRLGAAQADEVMQRLRTRLFTTDKLASYEGAGPLAAWVRAVATRLALEVKEQLAAQPEALQGVDAPLLDDDVELKYLHSAHREAFRAAFAEALATLAPREAVVLQLHFSQGVSMEKLGQAYRVNKSTVSRWVASAGTALRKALRKNLAQRLSLSPRELDSWLRGAEQLFTVSLPCLPELEPGRSTKR